MKNDHKTWTQVLQMKYKIARFQTKKSSRQTDLHHQRKPRENRPDQHPRRHQPQPPPSANRLERIFSRLNSLAVAANTEVFWLTIPKLEGVDYYDPTLMAEIENACQTFSWTLLDIATDTTLTKRPGLRSRRN